MVESLILKGADVNAKIFCILIIVKQINERHWNKNNASPLRIAAEYDSNKMGELLISKGADINATDIIYQIIQKLLLIILIHNK